MNLEATESTGDWTKREAKDTALMSSSDRFISMVLEQPNSAEKVALMRELIAMRNEERAREARELFERRFADMRRELPTIKKTKEVKRASGQHMYNYAPLEEIQKICDPILHQFGFSYSWREEAIEGGKRVWFDLFGHGHTKSNCFDAPLLGAKQSNSGGEIVNAVQAARMTSSYAKRNSMVDGLGLVIEDEDTDGTYTIDPELQETLEKLRFAESVEKLMDYHKIAQERYAGDPDKLRLIVGEYGLAKVKFRTVK